jgi:hypothetical protein
LDVQFTGTVTAAEISSYVNSVALVGLKESTHVVSEACQDPVVVLLPSATYAGKFFRPDERPIQFALSQGIDLNQSPLCLFHEPAMVRVSPPDSKQDARQILLDLAAPLVSHIPLLQAIFSMGTSEFSFRAIWPAKESWLHSQVSLLEHRFDHNRAFLELVYIKSIVSRWKEIVMIGDSRADRVGYLYKQSSNREKAPKTSKFDKKRRATESHLNFAQAGGAVGEEPAGGKSIKSVVSKKSKRWFVLKGIFLAYFKARDDAIPSCVIPLDYYVVRLSDEYRKGERVMALDKYVSGFPKGALEDIVLAAELENENELRLWFQSTNGKCANTALNRVFGMPLLHQLCHNQFGYVKKKSIGPEEPLFLLPPFLTQCIKYLTSDGIDQEGIFRIGHTVTEVQSYRDYFDTGAEIDLHGISPHCVAALMKTWLRELPEPLIPDNLYGTCIQAVGSTKDKELKTEKILQIIEQVPLNSLRTIAYITNFMKQIVSYTYLNKMTFEALSIVLSPCILRRSDDQYEQDSPDYNPLQLLNETPMINEVGLILFENSERVAQAVDRLESIEAVCRLTLQHEQNLTQQQGSKNSLSASTPNPDPRRVSSAQTLVHTQAAQSQYHNGANMPLNGNYTQSAGASPRGAALSHSTSQPQFSVPSGLSAPHQTSYSGYQAPQSQSLTHSPAQQRSPGLSPASSQQSNGSSLLAGSGSDHPMSGSASLSHQSVSSASGFNNSKVKKFQVPAIPALTELSHRPRNGSNGVIRSLNEELPPLREGQITLFTPSGKTPTVTIEPSPRSLNNAPQKWGRRHRNTAQWKGGAVGNGRVSGTTSPTPLCAESAPTTARNYLDSSEVTSEDESSSRRASEDHSLSALAMESRLLSAGIAREFHDHSHISHHGHHHPGTTSASLSPRGAISQWSQPVSPDPEARLLSMLMTLQTSHDLLCAKVSFLEERLQQETLLRMALEAKVQALTD